MTLGLRFASVSLLALAVLTLGCGATASTIVLLAPAQGGHVVIACWSGKAHAYTLDTSSCVRAIPDGARVHTLGVPGVASAANHVRLHPCSDPSEEEEDGVRLSTDKSGYAVWPADRKVWLPPTGGPELLSDKERSAIDGKIAQVIQVDVDGDGVIDRLVEARGEADSDEPSVFLLDGKERPMRRIVIGGGLDNVEAAAEVEPGGPAVLVLYFENEGGNEWTAVRLVGDELSYVGGVTCAD